MHGENKEHTLGHGIAIPQEVWREIILKIVVRHQVSLSQNARNHDDTAAVRRVCRLFHEMVDHNIESLSIYDRNQSEKNWKRFFSRFRSLKTLQCIRSSSALQATDMLSSLTTLRISDCKTFEDDHVRLIMTLVNLKSIKFVVCHKLSDEGVARLRGLHSLTSVELATCDRITGSCIVALSELPSLCTLSLCMCSRISSLDMISGLPKLVNLRSLDLSGINTVTDEVAASLGSLKRLEKLVMSWCLMVSKRGVASLSRLKNLQSLSLSWSDNVTDDALPKLLTLKNLRVLDIQYCGNITDAGLKVLEEHPMLHVVGAETCPKHNLSST